MRAIKPMLSIYEKRSFPGLLTTFGEFLAETHWAKEELSYDDL
jgi:hypothetical protein